MDALRPTPLELTAFIQVSLNGKVQNEYEIRSPTVSLGRSPDCDITIDNAAVSAFHALLTFSRGRLTIEDAASTNGVLLDGAKHRSIEVGVGQSVNIAGKYSLRLVKAPSGIPIEVTPKARSVDVEHKETLLVGTFTLARLSQAMRPAYVTLSAPNASSWICRLDKPAVTIGGGRSSDIQVSGWFTPRHLARIEYRGDGYYLCPAARRAVVVDGQTVAGELRLQEGSRFRVRNLSAVFHERARATG